jgi:hypothetical protein
MWLSLNPLTTGFRNLAEIIPMYIALWLTAAFLT